MVSKNHISSKPKKWIISIVVFLFLVSCGPQEPPPPGLRAINQQNARAILTEYKGTPPYWRLTLLDLFTFDTVELTDENDEIDSNTAVLLSPNAEYIAFKLSDGWYLQRIKDGKQQKLTEYGEKFEFLPDNRILIWLTKNVTSFIPIIDRLSVVDLQDFDLENGLQREVLYSNIRFIFQGQYDHCQDNQQVMCKTWALIHDDWQVTRITFSPRGEDMQRLSDSITNETTHLLQDVITKSRIIFDTQWNAQISEMDEVELQNMKDSINPEMTDEQLADYYFHILSPGWISVIGSPDGKKYLILSFEEIESGDDSITEYFLYLVDFDAGTNTVLSSKTNWEPFFSFSPDGTQILFESNIQFKSGADGVHNWYLSNLDLFDMNLLNLPEDATDIQWHK